MTLIHDMTNKELISNYESHYQMVEITECFSSTDLQYYYACEEELVRRGYEIQDRGKNKFPKIIKVSDYIKEKVLLT